MENNEIDALPSSMQKAYAKAKEMIEKYDDIKIYSHVDCDGISAGAILSILLERLDKEFDIEIVSLDLLDDIPINHELTIFSDLGSGQFIEKNATVDNNILILDHHPSRRLRGYHPENVGEFLEINPMYYSINGTREVSGGGLCYFLAKEFGFTDLSWIGVLAAVGDMQNSQTGKLEGVNRIILGDSVYEDLIRVNNDLNIYGRQTRPFYKALSYFSDVQLPITNNTNETLALLNDLDIPVKYGEEWLTLSDLTREEKSRVGSELLSMLSNELPSEYVQYIPKLIFADTYDLLNEVEHTTLRDISEFSSAMNACVRNDRPDIALRIIKGERDEAYEELKHLSWKHRRYLAQVINSFPTGSIIQMDNIQYFDGSGIRSVVVGTITGMLLGYGDWRKPLLGFAEVSNENHDFKISLRCSRLLSYSGIHFGNLIREVSAEVGGSGGGHDVACGAYIPHDKLNEFLDEFNSRLDGVI